MSEEKRQQVIALGRLGWTLRRIEQETGVRRETAGDYLRAAGVAVRAPGGWGRLAPAKPANEVSPEPEADPATQISKPANEVSPDSTGDLMSKVYSLQRLCSGPILCALAGLAHEQTSNARIGKSSWEIEEKAWSEIVCNAIEKKLSLRPLTFLMAYEDVERLEP